MSGPKTARYRISAEARERARREAARRREEHLVHLRSAVEACDALESECERLRAFAKSLKTQYPSESFDLDLVSGARPDLNNLEKLTQYAASTQKGLEKAKQQLSELAAQANINKQFSNALRSAVNCLDGDPKHISETVKILAGSMNAPPQDENKARASQCNRILARLCIPARVPVELQTLASEYINASNAQRATALESELRLRVKNVNASWENQQHDQKSAKKLLIMLDEVGVDDNSDLRQQLQRVACGLGLMSGELKIKANEAAQMALAKDAEEDKRKAAHIVQAALKDLGYTTEPIRDTLFVQGGTVHFQRAGWGEYFVRLRVRPDKQEVNFNVIRTVVGDQQREPGRSTLDAEAEAVWCNEFNDLLAEIQSRGIEAKISRQLEPGELPVQSVAAQDVLILGTTSRKRRSKPHARQRRIPPH